LSNLEIVLRVLGVGLAFGLLTWLGVALVKSAKRGGKRMQAIGAAMMLVGWGSMRDPANNPVAEAKDGRIRRGEYGGDPTD
jgi:hypothetical protein